MARLTMRTTAWTARCGRPAAVAAGRRRAARRLPAKANQDKGEVTRRDGMLRRQRGPKLVARSSVGGEGTGAAAATVGRAEEAPALEEGGRASSSGVGSGTAEHAAEAGASPRVTGRDLVSRSLGSSLRSNAFGLVRALVVLAVVTAVILAQPLLSGAFFQSLVVPAPDRLAIRRVLCAMLAAYALEPVCTYLYVTTMSRVAQDFVSDLQKKLFASILSQGTAFFDLNDTTSLLSIVSTEVNTVADVLGGNLSRDRGLRAVLEAAGGVVVLGMIAPQLAPVLLAFIFLTSVNAALYSRTTKGLFARREIFKLKMNAGATTAFSNIKTVRSFAAEGHEFRGFLGMLRRADGIGLSLGESKARLESLSRFAIYSSLILLYAYGGNLVVSGRMPVKSLIAGIGYTFSLVFATQGITNTFADAQRAMASIRRIEGFVDAASSPLMAASTEEEILRGLRSQCEEREDDCGPEQPPTAATLRGRKDRALSLRVDSFRYPTRPEAVALRGVSVELRSGKITALVGPSGAGKSTIVQLLSRFYDLEEGSLTLDGVDASRFSRKDWSDAVSLVGQNPVLFPGTIRENIAYALEGATDSMVKEAAAAANAHEFIESLPDGYDTDVGEAGGRLSGGQRQRIAIARAFIRDAPILLLDEATSALDNESERLVQSALERLYSQKAVLVIAHRLSTVVNADEILVVEEGRVVDRGTHRELLARSGAYQRLIGSQQIGLSPG